MSRDNKLLIYKDLRMIANTLRYTSFYDAESSTQVILQRGSSQKLVDYVFASSPR